MPSGKTRVSANLTENVGISINEKILRECHRLYTEEDKGRYSSLACKMQYFFLRKSVFLHTATK